MSYSAPSPKQLDFVSDLCRQIRIPAAVLDQICVDRFHVPFAEIDWRQCSQLLHEMIEWKALPATYQIAMGQEVLPGLGL